MTVTVSQYELNKINYIKIDSTFPLSVHPIRNRHHLGRKHDSPELRRPAMDAVGVSRLRSLHHRTLRQLLHADLSQGNDDKGANISQRPFHQSQREVGFEK